MTTLTLTDAKVPTIVARALADAMRSGAPAPVVRFGPFTLRGDAAGFGLWDCASDAGHAPLANVPTASAIAWLQHNARGSRVTY